MNDNDIAWREAYRDPDFDADYVPTKRRGSKPKPFPIDDEQIEALRMIVNSPGVWIEWQIRNARIILAITSGYGISDVAEKLSFSRTSVQRICRTFEKAGVSALMLRNRPTGRPRVTYR
jgi:hypothetical protein